MTAPTTSAAQRRAMDRYVATVVKDWERYWRDRPDHRYGRDFHAFLGERILTDFDLRHHDRTPCRSASTRLETWLTDDCEHVVLKLTISEHDMRAMTREQLHMIADATWLIQRALAADTQGPLTLPNTGIPVRQ
jgi:hypothetical protein